MFLNTPIAYWLAFLAGIFALMALDLGVFNRKAHTPSIKSAAGWSLFYVALAVLFGLTMPLYHPRAEVAAMEFFTAYALEKTLSLDNIFVISLIFGALKIPPQYQHRILFWGILGVIVMRGAFIAAGAAIVSQFSWVLAIFGVFLIYTGAKMFGSQEEETKDVADSKLLAWLQTHLPVTSLMNGRFFAPIHTSGIWTDGKHTHLGKREWKVTPLFIALVMVEFFDLVFALDSIPAAFAVTQDAFVIFSSNLFAILGLRSLYFVLLGMLDRFKYLGAAVSMVLVFIGLKILLQIPIGTLDGIHIPPAYSLGVVLAMLGGGVVVSLIKSGKQP